MSYSFLQNSKSDVGKIQKFIKDYYKKKNHILSKSLNVFNFFFNFYKREKINFISQKKNGKIISIFGYVPNNNWDFKLKNDVYLGWWQNKSKKDNGLLNLIYFLKKDWESIYSMGLNKKNSKKIIDFFGWKFNYLKHFYIKNYNIKTTIAKLKERKEFKYSNTAFKYEYNKKIKKLPDHPYFPKKSVAYFKNKFLNNPFFDYFVLKIFLKKKLICIFIVKEIKIKKIGTVLRIVDFYGNLPTSNIYIIFKEIINSKKAQYIDFLNYGLKEEKIKKMGFSKKSYGEIIPNHFDPYKKKNTDINICEIKNPYKKMFICCKGDAEQERPNKLKL